MDHDQIALVEKIVKDLNYILSSDTHLISFDVIPVDKNTKNKSPILLINESLALESWCVKLIYSYCYSEIKENYLLKPKRKLSKITSEDADRLFNITNIILLLNPDLSTLWNQRRQLLLRETTNRNFELRFTQIVLSRKPKCNDVFAYRRWLFDLNFKEEIYNNALEVFVNSELQVCELTSGLSANNYHSWSHRLWMINKIKASNWDQLIGSLYVTEYVFAEKWTSRNVSDYCCYHYRQFCIKNLLTITTQDKWLLFEHSLGLQERIFLEFIYSHLPKTIEFNIDKTKVQASSDEYVLQLILGEPLKDCKCKNKIDFICRKLDLLFREMFLNNENIRFFIHHETLWYHRRFIIHELLMTIYEYFGLERSDGLLVKVGCRGCNAEATEEPVVVNHDNCDMFNSKLFCSLVAHEKKFTRDRKADCDAYNADRHSKFLHVVEGLDGMVTEE